MTSGGTEAINSVLNQHHLVSLCVKTVISSPIEHSATLASLTALNKQGIETRWVRNTSTGGLDYQNLESLCQANPHALISIMAVNNETGVINDMKTIANIAKQNACLLHLDAVQALGKLTCDLGSFDYDFASISGHKIGSLKGVGALIVKDPKKFHGMIHGGSQEQGKRGGTTNILGIKTLLLALKDASRWDLQQIKRNSEEIFSMIKSIVPDAAINCESEDRICNTLNIFLPNRTAKSVLLNLGRAGVMVSTGSACTSGSDRPSYVIENLYGYERALSSVRISIGPDTTWQGMITPLHNSLKY